MRILGINYFGHDSSAALLEDGRIRHLYEEERLRREKHTKAYPIYAVNTVLFHTPGHAEGIDVVAYPFRVDDEVFYEIIRRGVRAGIGSERWIAYRLKHQEYLKDRRRWAKERFGLDAPFFHVGHHESHMASVFYPSPYDRSAILTVDGLGDVESAAFGIGEGTRITVLDRMYHPHGLGYLYSQITEYLGFAPKSDEGKVMGLAPYGRPTLRPAFEKLVRLEPQGKVTLDIDYFWHHTEAGINPRMAELLGPPRNAGEPIEARHEDIAFCLQERTEQALFHMLEHLRKITGCNRLCLAGGVALNSCANGKVLRETGFEDIYLVPYVHDAGTAIGAAQWVYHHELGQPRVEHRNLIYLGQEFPDETLRAALDERSLTYEVVSDPSETAARLIAEGKIVGWYQRRSEAGPRALGNRSILADPRRAEMKDVVNLRVKFREPFRPFAPAVCEERLAEFFEADPDGREPFMLRVYPVRRDKRHAIPAVTHVDGTGRVQSVARRDNPLYYRVIEAFGELTGVPVVLNTSFNVKGEPIVERPEQAVSCFLSTGIDALVLGKYLVTKNGSD